jgi:hypothetical protein
MDVIFGTIISILTTGIWYFLGLFEGDFLNYFSMAQTFVLWFLTYILIVVLFYNRKVRITQEKYTASAFWSQLRGSFMNQSAELITDLRKKGKRSETKIQIFQEEVAILLALAIASDMDPKKVEDNLTEVLSEEGRLFGNLLPSSPVIVHVLKSGNADIFINVPKVSITKEAITNKS